MDLQRTLPLLSESKNYRDWMARWSNRNPYKMLSCDLNAHAMSIQCIYTYLDGRQQNFSEMLKKISHRIIPVAECKMVLFAKVYSLSPLPPPMVFIKSIKGRNIAITMLPT